MKRLIFIFTLVFLLGVSESVFANENKELQTDVSNEEVSDIKVPEIDVLDVKVTDVEIGEYETDMYVGKSQSITATVLPTDATYSSISYSSSDDNIVKVSSTGEVKALAKGDAKIYIKAGDVTKEIAINVSIATNNISLNDDFIVLKPSESFKIEATVEPWTASQYLNFKVIDESVATVDAQGNVTAISNGHTTIIISNKDFIAPATVIVNSNNDEIIADENDNVIIDTPVEDDNITDQSWVKSDTLKDLYSTGKALTIDKTEYKLFISGSDIVNYNNELFTDLKLETRSGQTTFVVNDNAQLCGRIIIEFKKSYGKYLYIKNEATGKYELLSTTDSRKLDITSAGTYMLTEERIGINMQALVYILIAGAVLIVIGLVTYIIVKKRYWFW